MTDQTPGQLAYQAYATATGGLTHDGRPMPRWDDLGDRIRHAWASAALAVRTEPAMPQAEYGAAWTELTGYVQDALDCGEPIDVEHMAAYMAEIRRRALAPVREWVKRTAEQARPDDDTSGDR